MITLDDIIKNAKPHNFTGKVTRISNDKIFFSIVGGPSLYGDFEETFEVAVLDWTSKDFVTKLYFPEYGDDVIPYLQKDKLVEIINKVFYDNFRIL
jgi:hypothetical protein